MNLLLDTHIVLWSLLEPQKLSEATAEALENHNNTLYVSSISTWEILILAEKGKISLKTNDPVSWIRDVFKKIPLIELPINNEIAIQSRVIDLPQKDPADRFIAATALVHDMLLVSMDEKFQQNKQLKILV